METPPDRKKLRTVSFAMHATRGLLRDQTMRRRTMYALLVPALLMLLVGSTLLREALNPHEHALTFIVFWLACAWFTLTALLLAIYDLLIVRAQGRSAHCRMRKDFDQR